MTRVSLLDQSGGTREAFSVGETVFISAAGLPPSTLFAFAIASAGSSAQPELIAQYTSDRHGSITSTVLLPYVGLITMNDEHRPLTHAEAEKKMVGRRYTVHVTSLGVKPRFEHSLPFAIRGDDRRPSLFSSDPEGRLVTGAEVGKRDVGITLRNFPHGCVRVFVVKRQFGWRIGDPIEPVLKRDGTPLTVTTRIHENQANFVHVAHASDLGAGSYQFIARPYQPGWYNADELRLLDTDVLSDLRFASLVVRLGFKDKFGYDNGVALTPQLAGRPLAHRPYFRFLDNFPKGTDVYAALDPDALPSGLVSRRAAIYVIQHKIAAQWTASNALTDISGPGMSSAVKIVPIVPECVNWNTTLVWPNPQVPGKYDIAIDFGNNAADPSQFVPDGNLDAPLDMIDGYVRVGFYVTEDPSLPGPFSGSMGEHDYALGSINVPSTDAGPTPTDSLPLTATVRYPAQYGGIDAPFAPGAFPLVVIMHGNSGMDTSYRGYNYLLDHLASWGFVAMSIYAPVGVMIETRARAILAHIGIMAQNNANPGLFQGHIDLSQIGILGHSRGAEAVVRAARINTAEALGWNIRAGISIAPTDYFHYGDPGIPLLVIYGANDGDVSGSWPDRTCFDIYDEAGRPRSFVFVYGGTHDLFNTEWASIESTTELNWDIAPTDIPNLISMTDHENVAKGYVTAFFQGHLMGRAEQMEYFSAGLKPTLVSGLQVHVSHQVEGARLVDDFEQNNPAINTLGGAVTSSALSTFAEGQLRTLDGHSPHVVAGGNVAWQTSAGIYVTQVPAGSRDLSSYTNLTFRVTQKYESPQNPTGQGRDFHVRLSDGNGKSRAIQVSMFTDIPFPYVRGYDDLVKSAMKTVRIPLASYAIANAGAQDVDLTDVTSISFEFDQNSTGEVEIDEIEFSS
jgi:dienelactone hydrolase